MVDKLRPGLLLDRDGVINVEVHRLHRTQDLLFVPGVLDALVEISRWDVPIAVVSNQAGIGHGLYSDSDCRMVNAEIDRRLRAGGGRIDGFFYCPHRPVDGCGCRKPAAGLLRQAAETLSLDLSRSILVGDKLTDLQAASAVGCAALLVRTGHGRTEEQVGRGAGFDLRGRCFDSLPAAVPELARIFGRART